MLTDTQMVQKSDQEQKSAGKTQTSKVQGMHRQSPGEDPYIEIKAPSTVGNRSSVPYVRVLPSYRKRAESALERQQIPKEHERRVREYFESLGR